jgi:hypothetical protein
MAVDLPADEFTVRRLLKWAGDRLRIQSFGTDAYPIAVLRDGKIAAVVVYHHRRTCSLEMSIAADSPRWATRQTVSYLLSYPFLAHPNIRRVTALIERENKRSPTG